MTLDEALELGRAWPSWEARTSDGGPAIFRAILVADPTKTRVQSLAAYVRAGVGGGWVYADDSPVNDFYAEVVPDFRDPGTRGHALEQVREAWGGSLYRAVIDVQDLPDREDLNERWAVEILRWSDSFREYEPDFEHVFQGATEAAALLAARKAAP